MFAIKIEGTDIANVYLAYRTTNNKKVKELNNEALPPNGLIKFDPPILMTSFELKITSLANNAQLVNGFKFDILACAEGLERPVYEANVTSTPYPTYPSELQSTLFTV